VAEPGRLANQDYEAQLKEYNAAFTAFFARLANDGINKTNTLFHVDRRRG
jgi:hypothetical protein